MQSSLVRISLLAIMAVAVLAARSEADERYEDLVIRIISGDSSARQQILAEGTAAISALEAALDEGPDLSSTRLDELIVLLDHDSYEIRKSAWQELMTMPPSLLPLMQEISTSAESAEVRYRLQVVVASYADRPSREEVIRDLLEELYTDYASELLPSILAEIGQDTGATRLQHFLETVSHNDISSQLSELTTENQIRFYLAKIHINPAETASTIQLRNFSGDEVLAQASELYWPIELEPLDSENSTYHWITLCERIEGNTAINVIKVSVDLEKEDHPLIQFKAWEKWVYLWSYDEAISGNIHGLALGVRSERRVRAEEVRNIPEETSLPVVRMSERELNSWTTGRAFLWAEDLIPEEYRGLLRFRESRYEQPAEVISTP